MRNVGCARSGMLQIDTLRQSIAPVVLTGRVGDPALRQPVQCDSVLSIGERQQVQITGTI
jgi:hypothetical protein